LVDRDSLAIDTVNGFKRAGEYNIGMSMATKIYGTKQFKHLGNWQAIRHVMTPSFSFSYKPDFSASNYGYYKELKTYTNDIRPGRSVLIPDAPQLKDYLGRIQKYSIFEQGLYGGPSAGKQANLSFSVDNNVELKIKSKKDTVNGGEKKIPIIQGLSFSGTYNFAELSNKKLSPINFGGRSQFSEKLGFNFSGSLNPYLVDSVVNIYSGSSGQPITKSLQETDRYVFSKGKLPRLTSFTLSFDYSLNPEALKSRNKSMEELRNQNTPAGRTPEQQAELEAISRDPNAFVDFNIPWNIAVSYIFNYSNSLGVAATRTISNTLTFNGDFTLTQKWKIQFQSGYDFDAKALSYTTFGIYRDLHCWQLNASWIPFGSYAQYSVTIAVREAILQDLKLSKRKGYYTKY
jgi:hypothetical protein